MKRLLLYFLLCAGAFCLPEADAYAQQKRRPVKQTHATVFSSRPLIYWKSIYVDFIGTDDDPPMPAHFNTYRLDEKKLAQFFSLFNDRSHTAGVSVPAGGKAMSFTVKNSTVFSDALAARHPEIKSLQGYGTGIAKGADIRLDWDGRYLSGQVITATGKVYIIKVIPTTPEDMYIIYDKADSREPKEHFETAPGSR